MCDIRVAVYFGVQVFSTLTSRVISAKTVTYSEFAGNVVTVPTMTCVTGAIMMVHTILNIASLSCPPPTLQGTVC